MECFFNFYDHLKWRMLVYSMLRLLLFSLYFLCAYVTWHRLCVHSKLFAPNSLARELTNQNETLISGFTNINILWFGMQTSLRTKGAAKCLNMTCFILLSLVNTFIWNHIFPDCVSVSSRIVSVPCKLSYFTCWKYPPRLVHLESPEAKKNKNSVAWAKL